MNPNKKPATLKSLKSLMATRHFGAKRRARHKMAQKKYFMKKAGKPYFPF